MTRRARTSSNQRGGLPRAKGAVPGSPGVASPTSLGSLRAFPGAEGEGADATGVAREAGCQLLYVKNLNDSGADSLRAAFTTAGPRLIFFETSGQLLINSPLTGAPNQQHILGQSAPSPGISIETSGSWSGNQMVVLGGTQNFLQHVRIRNTGAAKDTLFLAGGGGTNTDQIADHVSCYWTHDELGDMNNVLRATISNCLMAQPVVTGGGTGAGYGILVTRGSRQATILRNLYVHTHDRMPGHWNDNTTGHMINCGGYNHTGNVGSSMGGGTQPRKQCLINFIGCKTWAGPDGDGFHGYITNVQIPADGSVIYTSDLDASEWFLVDVQASWTYRTGGLENVALALPTHLTILARSVLGDHLEQYAGARPLDRDALDQQMIDEFVAGNQGTWVAAPGTPPTLAVNTTPWSTIIPSAVPDPFGVRADGYTNIEAYIYDTMTLAVQPVPLGI